jgi:hypothetical protein
MKKAATLHVYAPHLLDGQGMVSGFSFPFETNTHGMINHVGPIYWEILFALIKCTVYTGRRDS